MRRKDREMDKNSALAVADKCEYAVLSLISPEGKPYAIPLSVVRDGENMYFHCAMKGEKIDCMRNDPNGCMVCVGNTELQPEKFTTKFESAIIKGQLSEVTNEAEKNHTLRILCEKYTPTNMADFDNAIARSISRTAIWKMSIDEITGKCKK